MENDNNTPSEIEVAGSLVDPLTQERLKAVAKASKPKGIKARHTVTTTETVKVASAFGAVSKEVTVEKVVEKTLQADAKGEQDKVTVDAPTEDEKDAAVRAKLVANGTPENEIEAKIAEARKIRESLTGLWSQDIKKTSSADDIYIEGLGSDGGGTRNPEAGDSGVRIKFTSKPRE